MSRRTQKNVGVIGLGIIGSRVAENLRRRGFQVFVWNRTPRPFPNFVGSRAEVADLCDFIQIFVSDDEALLESVGKIKRSLKAHHIVMAHSTVAPHTMRAAAEIVQRKGAQFLDAPFTGSKDAAEKGELVYYVAGDDATLQRARPVLEASSKEIVEVGEVGQATVIKVATNMITATAVQATAEALALVHSAGLSADKFAAAMRGNGSQSATIAMKLPNMISGDFETHFSTTNMLKDVLIASRLARSYGLNLGATEAARDSLRAEAEAGRGEYDYCSLVRVFFPEGMSKNAEADAAEEGQQTLAGLDGGSANEPVVAPIESDAGERETSASASGVMQSDTGASAMKEEGGDSERVEVEQARLAAAEVRALPTVLANFSDEVVPESSTAVVESPNMRELAEVPATQEGTPTSAEETPQKDAGERDAQTAGSSPAPGEEDDSHSRSLLSRLFGRAGDY